MTMFIRYGKPMHQAFSFLIMFNLYCNCTVYLYFIGEENVAQRG